MMRKIVLLAAFVLLIPCLAMAGGHKLLDYRDLWQPKPVSHNVCPDISHEFCGWGPVVRPVQCECVLLREVQR